MQGHFNFSFPVPEKDNELVIAAYFDGALEIYFGSGSVNYKKMDEIRLMVGHLKEDLSKFKDILNDVEHDFNNISWDKYDYQRIPDNHILNGMIWLNNGDWYKYEFLFSFSDDEFTYDWKKYSPCPDIPGRLNQKLIKRANR